MLSFLMSNFLSIMFIITSAVLFAYCKYWQLIGSYLIGYATYSSVSKPKTLKLGKMLYAKHLNLKGYSMLFLASGLSPIYWFLAIVPFVISLKLFYQSDKEMSQINQTEDGNISNRR